MTFQVPGMCSFCGYLKNCVEVRLVRITALICRQCLRAAVTAELPAKRPPGRAAPAGSQAKREAAG